ncbi:FtsW/RodA/SpoVE family cell cycle protein, partial [Glaesserella parasuis]|nr:FtsW/RodA/SpoVE family cell cycle protein [Glaesserella parasuis]
MLEKIRIEWDKWTRLTPVNALYDRTLVWLFLALLIIGFVMVTSASIPVSSRLHEDPFYFAVRDGFYVIASICACAFFVQIPSKYWEKYNGWLFISALLLL